MDHNHIDIDLPPFLRDEALPAPDGGVEAYPPTFVSHPDWFNVPYITDHDQDTLDTVPFDYSTAPPPPASINSYLSPTSGLGLPVYSASGFDLLSVLAKVVNRKNPQIQLGPVDLTCSFVVVDTRRFDHPIVYCSPTFCTLTGYAENEVVGKNCRFLQAPGGLVKKGERRTCTSHDAVAHLKKSLVNDKECQTSIVNYKKDGSAFINLVTVIPIPSGDDGEGPIVYQIGFQVDLTEQPNAILERLRDGSYVVNYQQQQSKALPVPGKERKSAPPLAPLVMSPRLKALLADERFLRSIPITPPYTAPPPQPTSSTTEPQSQPAPNHPLHSILLECTPDFIHVVSLKGIFLYVSPSVRRVLGYESSELLGLGWADLAHKEDVVPLMRELKESSALTSTPIGVDLNIGAPAGPVLPRLVDLNFRAKTKMGRYVWVECRGRLHVEPGKGRKAIILTARARDMNHLPWADINLAGGLACNLKSTYEEFWGFLSGFSVRTMTLQSATRGILDVLGYTPEEALGLHVRKLLPPREDDALRLFDTIIRRIRLYQDRQQGVAYALAQEIAPEASQRVHKIRCKLVAKTGSVVDAWFIIYRADADEPTTASSETDIPCLWRQGAGIASAPLVYQIRFADAPTMIASNNDGDANPQDVFEEFAISRGSSWQYELQQLRFTNQRLEDQLASLEAKLAETNMTSHPAQEPLPPTSQTDPAVQPSPPTLPHVSPSSSSPYHSRHPLYSRDTAVYYPSHSQPYQPFDSFAIPQPQHHVPASYQYQQYQLPPLVPPMSTPTWVNMELALPPQPTQPPPLQHPRPTRHDIGPSSPLKRSWASMDRGGRP